MAGAAFLASSNRERTRLAPTPTNISTKSEPEMLKKGTPASPATALASNVLPVPGGPSKRTPAGIRAPNFVKRFGSFKNSTTSTSSCFSSSAPATSEKRTLISSLLAALALFRPKLIGFLLLLPPIFPIIENKKKNKIANGTMDTRILIHIPLELSCFTSIDVLCSDASFCKSAIAVSDGNTILVNFSTFLAGGVKNWIPVSFFSVLGVLYTPDTSITLPLGW